MVNLKVVDLDVMSIHLEIVKVLGAGVAKPARRARTQSKACEIRMTKNNCMGRFLVENLVPQVSDACAEIAAQRAELNDRIHGNRPEAHDNRPARR